MKKRLLVVIIPVAILLAMRKPDAQRQKQIVRDLLDLWQTNDDCFGVGRHIATLLAGTSGETER